MKQKLLTDIELDVHELKYLMESFSKEPTQTLAELLKRSIMRMQENLGDLLQEVDTACVGPSLFSVSEKEESGKPVTEPDSPVTEEAAEEGEIPDSEKDESVVMPTPESAIAEKKENVESRVEICESAEEKNAVVAAETVIATTATTTAVVTEAETTTAAAAEEEEEEKKEEDNVENNLAVEKSAVMEDELKPKVLGESIKLSAGGLRRSISLNDSFRFSRELFGGDTSLMNRVIEQISVMSSYKTAVAFLSSKINVNEENDAVNDFLELLRKYFN
jgi:hypothetical protein